MILENRSGAVAGKMRRCADAVKPPPDRRLSRRNAGSGRHFAGGAPPGKREKCEQDQAWN
jgi:hypothetical protein